MDDDPYPVRSGTESAAEAAVTTPAFADADAMPEDRPPAPAIDEEATDAAATGTTVSTFEEAGAPLVDETQSEPGLVVDDDPYPVRSGDESTTKAEG